MWRITKTTDNQHIGTLLSHVEKGQIITFEDGDVVSVDEIFIKEGGQMLLAFGPNYQITLVKE